MRPRCDFWLSSVEPVFGKTVRSRNLWRGRRYSTKQSEADSVEEDGKWLVITVIVKYFDEKEADA